MRSTASAVVLTLAFFLFVAAGCGAGAPPAGDSAAAGDAAPPVGEPAAAAADDPAATSPAAPVPGAATPAAAAPATVLAVQETNWPAVVAEVTELRRRGNTLTARLRLTNQGDAVAEPDVSYNEVYLMDAAAGKKYEVLRDENGTYIAGLRSGWNNRWYQKLDPGQAFTIWMKFPAPPPEVRTITLQVPGMTPFEELPIQDS